VAPQTFRRFDPLSYLHANAVERPGAVAVYDLDRGLTFAELAGEVDRLAGRFRAEGLAEGEPIGVRLPNRWEYVALELAIPAAGGVILPLPLTLGEAELRWALEKSGARRVLGEADLPSLFEPGPPLPAGPTSVGPDRIVEIALTSGTTGLPKLASLSAKLKQATFEGFTIRLEVTEADRVLVMSPLTQGIGGMCLFCLRLGAGLIMLHEPRFNPETVLRLAGEHGATMLVGVPTNVFRLLESPALAAADLGAARITAVAGAPMPPDLAADWEDRTGSRVCVFYGSMDAGQLSVGSPSDPRPKRHHTVGRPHDCCEVLITPEGEICMRGDTVQERYWGETFGPYSADGWVHMGDLGHLDEDGYLVVAGRSKDLIIRGGTNINPHEVERALGERPVAFLVLRDGGSLPDLEAVRAFLDGLGMAKYKWPEEVRSIPEIPLSGPGKVNRKALQETLIT